MNIFMCEYRDEKEIYVICVGVCFSGEREGNGEWDLRFFNFFWIFFFFIIKI